MDNFFTSVPMARTLLQHQLTVVGTMRKCKREIPECMKAAKSRQTKTSVFGFNNRLTMVNYVPKKNKAVILLSTMHHGITIIVEDRKEMPEIIKFYSEIKIGVDLVDQMVQTYTCKRQTRQWSLILFKNVLDIAALNAYAAFRQVCPNYLSDHCLRRRRFITDLAKTLIMPYMMTRQIIPQLHKATKEAMMRCALGL